MLKVKDLMNDSPEVITTRASLRDALVMMNNAGYRHLPVLREDELVGIITDRDLRLAVNSPVVGGEARLERDEMLDEIGVVECMTVDPQCVSSDAPAHVVADLLSLNKFGAMPVLDDGRLVGIISVVDFLRHYAREKL